MSQNLFITGTGTDVGKTYVTGLIVKKLAQSGKKAFPTPHPWRRCAPMSMKPPFLLT